jgi:hypothetical protein
LERVARHCKHRAAFDVLMLHLRPINGQGRLRLTASLQANNKLAGDSVALPH